MKIENIPIIGPVTSFLTGEDIDYGLPVFIIGVLLIIVLLHKIGISQAKVVSFVFALTPIWLPITSFLIFFRTYMTMIRKKFFMKSGRTVLDIILPPEVYKTPEAMEYVFTQVWNAANPDNLFDTYRDGKSPLPYTYELVSRGGDVHFYATIPEKFVNGFTDAVYAQYPGVEIRPLDIDYTAEIPSDLKNLSFMSFHFQKKKPSAYPIKTYIDFGLDKPIKEEEKIDPITPMLEVLAGIQPHQQLWIQFICSAHREESFKTGSLTRKGTWESEVQAEIDKIMGRDSKTKTGPPELEGMPRLTPGERETVEAMERNMSKYAYNFSGRIVYISSKEGDYDGGLFARTIRSLAITEIKTRNGLGIRWRTDFNYKFLSDPFGKRIPALKKAELKEYKLRKLNKKSPAMSSKVLTVEELATLFHIPGSVAVTPTLNRVTSTRHEAPANLPTGNIPH